MPSTARSSTAPLRDKRDGWKRNVNVYAADQASFNKFKLKLPKHAFGEFGNYGLNFTTVSLALSLIMLSALLTHLAVQQLNSAASSPAGPTPSCEP